MPSSWVESRAVLAALVVGCSGAPSLALAQAVPDAGRGAIANGSPAAAGPGALSSSTGATSTEPSQNAPTGAPSYGKPRPRAKQPKTYPEPFRARPAPFSPDHPLPALEAYPTSSQARRELRQNSRAARRPPAPLRPPPPTIAAKPTLKSKPKPKIEDRPYDPIGIGFGSLRLKPFAEVSYGYDNNPNRLSANQSGSRLLRSEAGFDLKSDWSRHELQGALRLGYSDYFELQAASRPDGAGNLKARYDVTRETSINGEGRFSLDTQRPGAPALASGLSNVSVTNRPLIVSSGVSAGVTQKFNRLEVTLRGSYDRTIYENAHYSDGSTLNLSSTDYNAYGATARAAYEISPDIKPFLETTVDWRLHDATVDVSGYRRDSHGLSARAGASVNISELLKGEVSGGYAERHYTDPRLSKLRGPIVDAALIYTPSALSTVTLRKTTALSETTAAGASGVLTHMITAELSHDLLRNLNVTATGSYVTNDYQGAEIYERGYTAGVKLEYKITRSIAIRGSYLHERLNSTSKGSDYTADVFLIGLRLQP